MPLFALCKQKQTVNKTQHAPTYFEIGKKLEMMGKNTRDNLHVTCDCPKTHSGPYEDLKLFFGGGMGQSYMYDLICPP